MQAKASTQGAPLVSVTVAAEIMPPEIGGPATFLTALANRATSRRFRLQIVTYGTARPDVEDEGFVIRYVPRIRRALVFSWIRYVWHLARATPFRGVVFAQGLVRAGLPALLVSRLRRGRLVIRVPGDYAWEQAHRRRLVHCGPESFHFAQCPPWVRRLRWAERQIARSADHLIVPSEALRDLLDTWGVPLRKVTVVRNRLLDFETPEVSRQGAKALLGLSGDLIVSVGRLIPAKGLPALLHALVDLRNVNPDFKLVVVGDGPERRELEVLANRLGLTGSVIFAGTQARPTVALFLRAAVAFVLNSTSEGLSHSVLEAMHVGVPVIASDVPGNREVITHGYNGLLVNQDDGPAIRAAVLGLWREPGFSAQLVRGAHATLAASPAEDVVDRTFEILCAKLGSSAAPEVAELKL